MSSKKLCGTTKEIPCPYCGNMAKLVYGKDIPSYAAREELRDKPYHACLPCGAWVGCHRGTEVPLGVPASRQLRMLRAAAHEEFDKIWRTRRWAKRPNARKMLRRDAYQWLAHKLGIQVKECHIGMMNEEQCRQVIRVCRERRKAAGEVLLSTFEEAAERVREA
jgi:hypothetical protein